MNNYTRMKEFRRKYKPGMKLNPINNQYSHVKPIEIIEIISPNEDWPYYPRALIKEDRGIINEYAVSDSYLERFFEEPK